MADGGDLSSPLAPQPTPCTPLMAEGGDLSSPSVPQPTPCTPVVEELPLHPIHAVQKQRAEDGPSGYNYKHAAELLEEYMAAKGYKTYSLAVLEQYAIERFEEGRAPNTLKSEISLMKKYMKLDKKVDVGKAADLFKEIDKWEDEHDDHQAPSFEPEDIDCFLRTAPDAFEELKVFELISLFAAGRVDDIALTTWDVYQFDVKTGYIWYDVARGKNHQGKLPFCIPPVVCGIHVIPLFQSYKSHTEAALKKPSSKNRVFLRFDEKKQRYEARPVGKGIVRTWPSRIATFLVTAANVALAAGLSLEQVKRLGGWKSLAAVERYFRNSRHTIKTTANALAEVVSDPTMADIPPPGVSEPILKRARLDGAEVPEVVLPATGQIVLNITNFSGNLYFGKA